MTDHQRSPLTPLLMLLGAVAACGAPANNFIDAQGTYADGTPFHFHQEAKWIDTPSDPTMKLAACNTLKGAPCRTLEALLLAAPMNEALRGVRIDYARAKMADNTAYTSGIIEPVTLFAIRAVTSPCPTGVASCFLDSPIEGGQVTFSSIAMAPGDTSAGSFTDLALQRADDMGNTETLITISSGSFSYLQP